MRQQLMQVLGGEEHDGEMTDVVRRFWTRAKPLPVRVEKPQLQPQAQVVDLAGWARAHRTPAR
jgi:hypothetical protein